MPTISISEADFATVANAAREAQKSGDADEAKDLDKLARRMNLALSSSSYGAQLAKFAGGGAKGKKFTWRDMPSTLDL